MPNYVKVPPQGVIFDVKNIDIKWYQAINVYFTGGGYLDVWNRTQNAPISSPSGAYNVVLNTDYNSIFTSTAAATVINLPAATPGLEYRFRAVGANLITAQPQSGDHFFGFANGKYKRSSVDGSLLRISCSVAGVWDVEIEIGTWVNQP